MDLSLLIRLGIDTLSVFFIVGLLHYRLYKKSEYIFTYVIFNILIFLLSFVLQNNQMSMGAAFGLFAVFSIIRYRTEDITARDMTYLFIVIALGLLNAVHGLKLADSAAFDTALLTQMVVINVIIIVLAWILESSVLMKRELVQTVQYENIANIKPENRQVLLDDLSMRTGLKVHRVEIGKIDFLRDTATVKIYYYSAQEYQR
ncbi:MAG: hypothetical protein RL660_2027 [Bacteroidota bacterium]